jgi:hypothetical protein
LKKRKLSENNPAQVVEKLKQEHQRLLEPNKTRSEARGDTENFMMTIWHAPELFHGYAKERGLPLADVYVDHTAYRDHLAKAHPSLLDAGVIATEAKHFNADDPRFRNCLLGSTTMTAVGQCSIEPPGAWVMKLRRKDGTHPYVADGMRSVFEFLCREGEALEK